MSETKKKAVAHYEILDELGRGGFATVYRARDTRMEREVALKVIVGGFTHERKFIERFRLEARTAANLQHPNIVPVHDFGDDDGTLYLVMALVGEGHTLSDLLAESDPLDLEHALPILSQIADALDYLHCQEPPLIHRDVKPSNVLLSGSPDAPWVRLTDFGLVRSMESSAELTQSNAILGSPAYMAPEQADPKKWGEITPLTDIYALGVVAYEMLIGNLPFKGEGLTVMRAHADDSPTPPSECFSGLGEDLDEVLLRALAKSPNSRYPHAGALVAALREVADSRILEAERETTLEQLENRAQQLLDAGEWLEALDCCTQMVRLDPDRPATLEMLTAAKQGLDRQQAEAVQRRRLEERYDEGLKLLAEEKWKQAIVALEEVESGNPDFRDVQEKLALAREEHQRAQWYDEAIAHGEDERWAEACRAWVNVLRGYLTYRDGDAAERLLDATEGLLSRYEELTSGFKQTRKALALYDKLALAIKAGAWKGVIEAGDELLQLTPDLNGAQAWLGRAHRKLELQEAAERDRIIWEQDGKEMVHIPAGEFLYGDNEETRSLSEYWIDRTPVTNAEYARFVAETGHEPPSHWKGKAPPQEIADHPVVNVTWRDAVAYAEWAGKQLPTEEEWEKAARGTDGREYPWGDWQEGRCNTREAGIEDTTPVGQYSPDSDSPYGCADMVGNVWEWTASEHEAAKDTRVVRGGSWLVSRVSARCTGRYGDPPGGSFDDVGFRCVSPVGPDS